MSEPPLSGGRVRAVPSGEGIQPERPVLALGQPRVKKTSLPPAPDGKPGIFNSSPPSSSDRPPPREGGGEALFGADDDDEWDAAGALDVGLDYGSEEPPSALPAAPSPPDAPEPSGMDLAGDVREPVPSVRRPPTSRAATVGDSRPAFSPEEIEAVARFGASPTNPLFAPLYAFKVYQRRRELQQGLGLQKRTHEQATTTLRSKLADIADSVMAKVEPAQMEGAMGPIRAAEQKINDRKAQLEAASGQFASQFKSIQAKLDDEAKARQQLDRDRNMAQIKVEDAVHKRAQVAAELKRVNVEMEAAHEAAVQAAGANAAFAPPEHAKRITSLEAQRAKLAEQLSERDRVLVDARAELKERQRGLAQLEQRVNGIHQSQARMEQEASQAQGMGVDALKQAQHERLVAYEVALEAITVQAPKLIDEATAAQIADVKRQIAHCDADLTKFELAIDAYDDGAYKRGIAIVIGVLVLALLGLISAARVQ